MLTIQKPLTFDLSEWAEIVKEHFPNFSSLQWHYMDEGVDCHTFITEGNNEKIVFRLPRFNAVAERLLREVELLRSLESLDFSVQAPDPIFVYSGCTGNPPWPFFGYPFIHGLQLSPKMFARIKSQSLKLNIARQLGQFLNNLHNFSLDKALKIGFDSHDQIKTLTRFWGEVQEFVFPLLDTFQCQWVSRLFEELFYDDHILDFFPKLIHGDLTDQHIIFNPLTNQIQGIIDFTDAHIGDPARDFAGLQVAYGDSFIHQVFTEYDHSVNIAFLRRVNFYVRIWSISAILCGVELSRPDYVNWGINRLQEDIRDDL